MKKLTDKEKVLKLFKANKVLFFFDISKKLDIDLKKTVKICRELINEGKIQVVL